MTGQLSHGNSNQEDSDPGGDAADNFGIRGTKNPSQILTAKVSKHPNHFQPEHPARVQSDRKIEIACAHQRITQNHSNKKKTENSWQEIERMVKRFEGAQEMTKSRPRFDAV